MHSVRPARLKPVCAGWRCRTTRATCRRICGMASPTRRCRHCNWLRPASDWGGHCGWCSAIHLPLAAAMLRWYSAGVEMTLFNPAPQFRQPTPTVSRPCTHWCRTPPPCCCSSAWWRSTKTACGPRPRSRRPACFMTAAASAAGSASNTWRKPSPAYAGYHAQQRGDTPGIGFLLGTGAMHAGPRNLRLAAH